LLVVLAAALITFSPRPEAIRPPSPSKAQRSAKIRVGHFSPGAGYLVKSPQPKYPDAARKACVEGRVEFRALIGKDGTIRSVELVSGHPLLVEPAKEAVQRWRYLPTLLDGQPVEVITNIAVTFYLPSSCGERRPRGK
jgi:protein TonB